MFRLDAPQNLQDIPQSNKYITKGVSAMRITIKVIGTELCSILHRDFAEFSNVFSRAPSQSEHFDWNIIQLSLVKAESLLSYPDNPSVLLIDAQDPTYVDRIQLLEKKEMTFIKNPPFLPIVLSPIILIFRNQKELSEVAEFPDFVADWLCIPFSTGDLIRRILAALRRKNILKTKLHFGSLTLIPELRVMCFQGKTIHLTPSEFSLAELFLNQMGTVIPMRELVLLFKSSGKSTEGSNIRVTIFQLRLKLEMLTRSRYTLASVYRQGYCLRTKLKSPSTKSSEKYAQPPIGRSIQGHGSLT
jgi:DNA-binding winged helix-turn-helix (wHTH) protein